MSDGSPSRGRRDRLEICTARIDKVCEDVRPVVPLVPRDLRGRIDLDWHHLADRAALNEYDRGADAACTSAALLATLDVCRDEWVARGDVCTGDDVCTLDDESAGER